MPIHDSQTHAIIGAAMEVHRVLGPGFLESVYHKALMKEFDIRAIPYRSEVDIDVLYKGEDINAIFRADFLCYEEIIVEIKAIRVLSPADEAQLINYLTATAMKRGLLITFGGESLQWIRRVRGYEH